MVLHSVYFKKLQKLKFINIIKNSYNLTKVKVTNLNRLRANNMKLGIN